MKTLFASLITVAASTVAGLASTITLWTFEPPNAPNNTTGKAGPVLSPAIGSGSATGSHANSSLYSSQTGNGSATAFSATAWSVGDYWQFSTSTLGYDQIQLSWDQASAANAHGPTNFTLLYSTDGQHYFTALERYQVYRNSSDPLGGGGGAGVWNATARNADYTRVLDLSSVSALQNAPQVFFELEATMQGSDYSEIDNFLVTGMAIPEPASLLGAGLAFTAAAFLRRARRP